MLNVCATRLARSKSRHLWLFVAAASIAGIATAHPTFSSVESDPLQPLASMLTQSVLITRGDAGADRKSIMVHTRSTHSTLAAFVSEAARSRTQPYNDDIHLSEDLGRILSLHEIGRHFLEHGDKHSAHHTFKGIRLLIGEIRSRNGVVAVGDLAWRYNCAFHPMMHEIMHHIGDEGITRAQVDVCRQASLAAGLALAALKAVAEREPYNRQKQLRVRIAGCEKSLENLTRALEKNETDSVVASVKAVRKAFIALASYEAGPGASGAE